MGSHLYFNTLCQIEHIAVSEPSSEHCLVYGPEFEKWEDFYLRYTDRMGKNKFTQLIDAYSRDEDLTPYEPKTDWRQSKPSRRKTSTKAAK